MYERGKALQRIAQGDPIDQVMEDMSRRIMDKLLHPVFKAIRESTNSDYDSVKSREEYFNKMSYRGPVADHVDGNLFDNTSEN